MARQVAGPTYAQLAGSRIFADNGSTGAQSALVIAPQALPTDALETGSVYVDSTSKALLVYNGTSFLPPSGVYTPVLKQLSATSVSENIFVADRAYTIVAVRAVPTIAGTDAGAVTLDLFKCTGTQAPSAGVTVLTATINLKATINTVITPTLSATPANLALAAGDRLATVLPGVMTAVVAHVELFLAAA